MAHSRLSFQQFAVNAAWLRDCAVWGGWFRFPPESLWRRAACLFHQKKMMSDPSAALDTVQHWSQWWCRCFQQIANVAGTHQRSATMAQLLLHCVNCKSRVWANYYHTWGSSRVRPRTTPILHLDATPSPHFGSSKHFHQPSIFQTCFFLTSGSRGSAVTVRRQGDPLGKWKLYCRAAKQPSHSYERWWTPMDKLVSNSPHNFWTVGGRTCKLHTGRPKKTSCWSEQC